jgi:hypothetical protein
MWCELEQLHDLISVDIESREGRGSRLPATAREEGENFYGMWHGTVTETSCDSTVVMRCVVSQHESSDAAASPS